MALGHCANWDLIGAWAATNLAPLTTVAEVVSPRALFDTFVRLRSRNHMNIVPAQKGRPVFGELLARARKGRGIFALLADRDITGAGIEVELFGQKALVAAGPAALAKQANLPLYVAVADQITLRGARLRAAGTKNGAELVVRGPIKVSDSVEETTQAWVDAFARELRPRLKSWHMCQPLFVSDLDPVRLARSRKKHEQMEKQS